jgi:asparagine synthase (glutamine-hydrolysing)
MCGIAGILNFNEAPVDVDALRKMVDRLSHRGPDDSGMTVRGQIGLGHRRLSIIDLEHGAQPMPNEEGSAWLVFNGEIYNYRDLRHDLVQHGHSFRTNSDSEVILHAYEQWGASCTERFRGMFAFAIADFKNKCLFVSRDHFGIKPLYYVLNSRFFAFASEIQALCQIPEVSRELNLRAMDQYLWLQYIPGPHTIWRAVQKLLPAHRLVVNFDGVTANPEQYWDLKIAPDTSRSEEELVEELDSVLEDTVRAHLVADVPFGAFLSGGVDSSGIVAYMAKVLHSRFKTFSIRFEEQAFDETPYSQEAANRWGTEHMVQTVSPKAIDILPDLVRHYGEPFGDSSAIPTYWVSKLASESVPMVLSGDGGDELFGGYESYLGWLSWLHADGRAFYKKLAYPFAHCLFPSRYPKRLPSLDNWFRHISFFPPDHRSRLWRPEYRSAFSTNLPGHEECFEKAAPLRDPFLKVEYLDFKTYLPFNILPKVDIASMMHGLEVRTPLVDLRVAEFAAALPVAMKISRTNGRLWNGKILLKKCLTKYYPEKFLARPKMGFSVPMKNWLGKRGALRHIAEKRLLSPNSRIGRYFEPSSIAEIFRSDNYYHFLWILLFLEEWLDQNQPN